MTVLQIIYDRTCYPELYICIAGYRPSIAPIWVSLLHISQKGMCAASVCLYAVIIMPMTSTPAVVHSALLSKHT